MGHGLIHPQDLHAWHRWQARRRRMRRLVPRLEASPPGFSPLVMAIGSPDADVLVVLDALTPSVLAALAGPLQHLPAERLKLLMPAGLSSPVPHMTEMTVSSDLRDQLEGTRALIGAGHYTVAGAAAWAAADALQIPTFVSQHGALTPFAPPLPADTRLLAWSDSDGDFWRSARGDISHEVVGSQLLWQSARRPTGGDVGAQPSLTYLGQGHAAEIPRSRMLEAALRFCRNHGATYRPHPSERDKLSRLAHEGMRRAGVRFDTSGAPLATWDGPVVSVFSTGVLEMAARGVDAWVDFPRPPAWLGEFWERYGMHRFGDTPTPAPTQPEVEPARRIAEILMSA